ncbi:hypothetical protein Pmani_039223 [Petrolisthes manimaculis]|uniref:Uncharacterized protein n=1 Tax=Petrolisthes manimaculis TaxID=1843537 RepID=A0AAE1NE39_9EUCA|nr:hypothetical protein Pmani_039223 [Petrolisthes manimaculis]
MFALNSIFNPVPFSLLSSHPLSPQPRYLLPSTPVSLCRSSPRLHIYHYHTIPPLEAPKPPASLNYPAHPPSPTAVSHATLKKIAIVSLLSSSSHYPHFTLFTSLPTLRSPHLLPPSSVSPHSTLQPLFAHSHHLISPVPPQPYTSIIQSTAADFSLWRVEEDAAQTSQLTNFVMALGLLA